MFKTALALAVNAGAATAQKLYDSGMLESTATHQYGKFVGMCSGPDEKGSVFGFFTMNSQPWVRMNSIELEVVPSVPAGPLSIDLSYGNGQGRVEEQSWDPFHPAKGAMHKYEFTWTPDAVRFLVDDVLKKSYGKDDPGVVNENKEQTIQFNMWAPRRDAHPDDWSLGRDEKTLPWHAACDYIEYHAWTGGDTFQLEWRDDFDGDALDASRWFAHDKDANFAENHVTYMRRNVYVADGRVNIVLDRAGAPIPAGGRVNIVLDKVGAPIPGTCGGCSRDGGKTCDDAWCNQSRENCLVHCSKGGTNGAAWYGDGGGDLPARMEEE